VQDIPGQFGAQQDEANLRSVAMGDDNPVALGNQRGDVVARLAGRAVLIQHGHMLGVLDQGIPADGNHDQGWFHAVLLKLQPGRPNPRPPWPGISTKSARPCQSGFDSVSGLAQHRRRGLLFQ
jgi:hypothetical protein